MWRRVELRNYRSIEHVKVDLAPFTLLVGPNGSGKSNFADALVFVRDVAFDAATAVEKRGGVTDIRRWSSGKPSEVSIDVRAAETRDELGHNFLRHGFRIHSRRTGAWSFRSEAIEVVENGEHLLDLVRRGHNIEVDVHSYERMAQMPALSETASAMVLARQLAILYRKPALRHIRRIRLNPEAMRQPQAASENTLLDESGNNIAVAYRSLKYTAKKDVLAAMEKIIPGLSSIDVKPFDRFLLLNFTQEQGAGERATFSASAMSEGALRALGILVAAQQIRMDELLIIEEPEVAIHIGAAQLLFDVLKRASERGAVLVTTHSADLLDAAKDEEILVCSYRDGVTKIGPLASEQRAVVKDGLFSVAELMRSEPLRIEGEPIPAVEP
ncbi:AAA family ATPase [Polyangium fumosum]|nr:AAA family ATPase [Polyangium fumosum]